MGEDRGSRLFHEDFRRGGRDRGSRVSHRDFRGGWRTEEAECPIEISGWGRGGQREQKTHLRVQGGGVEGAREVQAGRIEGADCFPESARKGYDGSEILICDEESRQPITECTGGAPTVSPPFFIPGIGTNRRALESIFQGSEPIAGH
eukprot:1183746-Prorocentrum_minimum.AAC.4